LERRGLIHPYGDRIRREGKWLAILILRGECAGS
jgi:hypothetical protein